MNNLLEEISKKYEISLEEESLRRAVSLACSIGLASIVQSNSDFPSNNHPPEHHIYWETRENVMERIRGTSIKIVQILRINKYTNQYLTRREIKNYAMPTWDEVKSNTLTVQEIMES